MAYGERHSWRDTRATTSLKEAWQMRDVVMVEAVRTAVGRLGGTIKDIEADRLAAGVIAEVVDRAGVDGTVTAGNASGRNDGAGAVLLMSGTKAEDLGLLPKARIISQAVCGVPPDIMGIGPVPATSRALDLAGLSLNDIDLIELNEAFAAQSIAVIKELGIDTDKVNINGGAISLGHPLGATGAIIMTKLIYDLNRMEKRYGLATLCIAGGLGIATIIENLQI